VTAPPLARAAIAGIGGAALLVPLGFVAGASFVPVPLRAILVLLWVTAVVRPHVAVLLLALVAPFGAVLLSAFDAAPIQYTEALVVATLSGALFAAASRRVAEAFRLASAPRHSATVLSPVLGPPAILLSIVVLSSLAVVLGVSQVGLGVRWPFVHGIATLLARHYLVSPPGQWSSMTAAARLLEGVFLLLVIARHARSAVDRPLHIMRSLVAAAAVAGALAIAQLANAVSAGQSFHDLWTTLLTGRFSAHVTDANAAGSYYAMTGLVAVGLALHSKERRPLRHLWAVIAAVLFAAMWLSGSRAAVVSVAAVLFVAAVAAARRRSGPWSLWSLATAALIVCVLGAFAIGFDPRAVERRSLLQAINERAAFAVTGLQMMAEAPVFGAGIGRYFETSGRFMPQSIYWFHFHENAHNNFLQIGGELGLAGLIAFVWLIGASAGRLRQGLRACPNDRVAAGAAVGLAAFVVTWMAGHPLLTPEVAVPFWILVGAAIARADQNRESVPAVIAHATAPAMTTGRPVRWALGMTMLFLVTTVPLRARREAAQLNLAEQSFGFYDWEGERATGRFRWTTPSAAFFVAPRTSELEVPMCAAWADHRRDATVVTFAIDGHIFHTLETRSGDWVTLRLRLPAPSRNDRYRRIDVTTTPAWSPAVVLGTHDSRVLGVQLGEVISR
jgi:hypothetical protein